MKNLPIVLIAALTLLAGCGKKEVDVTTTDAPAPAAVQEPQPQQEPANRDAGIAANAASLESSLAENVDSVVREVKKATMATASSVDWANLSWNDVSKVPFDDKDKLLDWVAPQIDTMKKQLASAAMKNGQLNLSALGDSGWQGAIKQVVSALDSVRTSSPQTYELARGALIMAWDALKTEASKYIGDGAAAN